MDYKVSVLGRNGFIGSALAKRFKSVYSYPHKKAKYLFYFSSPSSQEIFKDSLDYSMAETINGFLGVVRFCRENKIKLIYPSSATIYANKNAYAHCKSALEQIHQAYGGDVLGLRIFAGYGVGEEHKGEYASVVYKFCKQMVVGEQPVIWGNGEQSRDFVYIDDIIDTIIELKDTNGIFDIGTGVDTTFNEVVRLINKTLGKEIKSKYIKAPVNYLKDTPCQNPIKGKVSIEEGIKKICESLSLPQP